MVLWVCCACSICMSESLAPILRVADVEAAVEWHQQFGFVKEWEHRFAAGLSLHVGIARGDLRMHLSEHAGDARPGTLVYIYVVDVDAAADALVSPKSTTCPGVVTSRSPTPKAIG